MTPRPGGTGGTGGSGGSGGCGGCGGCGGTGRAGRFVQPRRYAFWVYLVLLFPGAGSVLRAIAQGRPVLPDGALTLVLLLHLGWLVPALRFVVRLDLFEPEPASLLAAAFAWGGLVAVGFAIQANNEIMSVLTKTDPSFAREWEAAIAGPTSEETLKLLGVVMIVLIAPVHIDRTIDGFVYGALVGLGFQVVEDVIYGLRAALEGGDDWVTAVVVTFVMRGFVNGLWSHAAYTAITGAGVAYFLTHRDRSRARRLAVAVVTFAAAWTLHFVNNSPLLRLLTGADNPFLPLAQTIANGMVTLVVAVVVYRVARAEEYRWFERVMAGDVGSEVITEEEVEALRTNRRRRREVRFTRALRGRRASRLRRRLQRAQLGYAIGKAHGADVSARRGEIGRLRAQLAAIERVR